MSEELVSSDEEEEDSPLVSKRRSIKPQKL